MQTIKLATLAWGSLVAAPLFTQTAFAQFSGFTPNNLVVSRSVYEGTSSILAVGTTLPPNCPSTAVCTVGPATGSGAFPAIDSSNNVWNNDPVDGSFGVTSLI